MRVSLILTVKNEAASIARLLDSILAQTRAPDEIIIADGGSTDDTSQLLHDYSARLPLKILSVPGSNISQGRNAAIRASNGELICSTDAGVRLDPTWMAELVRPFDSQSPPDIVSGFFLPDPHSIFESALAATTLPTLADIRPEKFLPSSRSIAFRKSAWEQVKGYPEWLDFCEDLILDLALRAKNFRFLFAPNARVYFRPRQNLRAFFKQYYQYARGDGKANLWLLRHLIRYATYLVALPVMLALLFSPYRIWGLGFLLLGLLAMFFTPYKRLPPLLKGFSPAACATAIVWVPIIRVAGDLAKMLGYPVGVVWRFRNRK